MQWNQFSLFQRCEIFCGVGYEKCVIANLAVFSYAKLSQSSIGFRNVTIIWTNLIPFSMVPGFKTGLRSIPKFETFCWIKNSTLHASVWKKHYWKNLNPLTWMLFYSNFPSVKLREILRHKLLHLRTKSFVEAVRTQKLERLFFGVFFGVIFFPFCHFVSFFLAFIFYNTLRIFISFRPLWLWDLLT